MDMKKFRPCLAVDNYMVALVMQLNRHARFLSLLVLGVFFFCIPASAATNVYYSVGTSAADLKTAATISIVTGTATLSAGQANNIGVGDKITYNGATICYISARSSNSVYSVVTNTGATPPNVTNVTVNSIKRTFNGLIAALTGASGAAYLNTANLVTGNYALNIACYGDGIDAGMALVDGWTTDASHYIKIYTPYLQSEVGTSQRHNGIWGVAGRYMIKTSGSGSAVIRVQDDFVKIYGLQVDMSGASGADAIRVDYSPGLIGAGAVEEIAYNLIKVTVQVDNQSGTGIWEESGSGNPITVKIWNNIYWDLTGSSDYAMWLGYQTAPTIYLYNNTIYNCVTGPYISKANVIAKNNLVYNCVNNYSGAFSALGTNNLSGPGASGAIPATNARNGVAVLFEDSANDDFRLTSGDTGARTFGVNLFSDPNCPFSDDLTGAVRPATWDIGARQWNDSTSTQMPVFVLPATNTIGNYYISVDFTLPEAALSGSVKMTFTQTGGAADANSPHVVIFKSNFETAGEHTTTMNGTAIGSNANVLSVNNGVLVNTSIYSVRLEYQDALGNPLAAVIHPTFTYSTTAVIPTLAAPATNGISGASLSVDFTLPQAATSGTVQTIFTRTGGSVDGSTHTITFKSGFETAAEHITTLDGTNLSNNANVLSVTGTNALVDGSIYSVTLQYNPGSGIQFVINTNWTYYHSAPSWVATYPKLGTVGATTLQFLVDINRNGQAFFVVVPHGATAPTPAYVQAGKDGTGSTVASGFAGTITLYTNIADNFSASNLTNGTAYDIYFIAQDMVGNLQASVSSILNVTTQDNTPPVWAGSYPKAGTIGGTTAQFLVETNENGKAYFVVVPHGAGAPTSVQVRAGQNSASVSVAAGFSGNVAFASNTEANFSASGLTPSTSYDVYLVAEDLVPNLQAAPVMINFSTIGDVTPPVWASTYPKIGSITTTTAQFLVETDENGTAYFVVVPHGAGAPSSVQVKAGQNSAGVLVAVGFSGNAALTANTQANFTATNLVSGTAYDVYLVAQDAVPNWQAAPVMLTITTVAQPTPNWSRYDLTSVNGAAIGDTKIFVGAGNTLYGLLLSNGTTSWSYTSGYGACGTPTYTYSSGAYRIVVCQGTYLIRYDDGVGLVWSVNLGAGPGTPYISTDNNSVFVLLGNNTLTNRSMTNGARVATFNGGSDKAVTNASISGDIVVYSGYVLVGSTDGIVTRYDADGTLNTSFTTGSNSSINQAMVAQNNVLYLAPAANLIYTRSATNLSTAAWAAGLNLTNPITGPPFVDQSASPPKIYIPAGTGVDRISDNGGFGAIDYTYTASTTVQSGPIPFNGYVYFGGNGGYFYCYKDADRTVPGNWPFRSASGNGTSGPWIDAVSGTKQVIFGTDAGDMRAFNAN
jgi:hypothetical protein